MRGLDPRRRAVLVAAFDGRAFYRPVGRGRSFYVVDAAAPRPRGAGRTVTPDARWLLDEGLVVQQRTGYSFHERGRLVPTDAGRARIGSHLIMLLMGAFGTRWTA